MASPDGFAWGVAAASYQVEGGAYDDGKGLSVWDVFCKKPGAVWNGQSGETACDHYHLWRKDVSLMKRFAIRVGIVHTDYVTLVRTPKDSAYWYKKVIETNGASLAE